MRIRSLLFKTAGLAIVLYGGVACIARADDSSNSRFGGDGYAYFNETRPIVEKARSEFRQEKKGLPETYYQGLSSSGPEWHPAPEINKSDTKFRQGNPKVISFSEYQAQSSNSSRWQSP